MSSASVTHDFSNGTIIDADAVDQNFTDLVNFMNTHLVHNHSDQWPVSMPRGELGYDEVVVDDTGNTAAEADITGLSVAVTAGTNRKLKITFHTAGFRATALDDIWSINIKEGTTHLNRKRVTGRDTGLASFGVSFAARVLGVTGAHTYKATLSRTSGAGTADLLASADYPMYLLVEDIGGT